MAGRGRGPPPKKKAEQRANHPSSRDHSVPSESDESSNSKRGSETLIHTKTQNSKPSTQSTTRTTPGHTLSGWIEAVQTSTNKEVNGKGCFQQPSMADGHGDKPKSADVLGSIQKSGSARSSVTWKESARRVNSGKRPTNQHPKLQQTEWVQGKAGQ